MEAKIRKNPDIRREVISQALSYAAHLEGMSVDEFNESVVGPWVENTTEGIESTDLYGSLEALGYAPPESIEDGLTKHLSNGDFVVLIVVDEPHRHLRRTVSYLNSHCDFDLYLVEVGYFRSVDGRQVISPRVLDA